MDIKQLKRFLDLCRTGSFTKTAENLFLSQQALSSSVNTLEAELGKPLFKRTPKGVVPTEEGLILQEMCEPLVRSFDEMERELSRRFEGKRSRIRFGLAPDVLQASSPDLILRFRLAYPHIEVKGVESSDTTCVDNVLSGAVDFSVCPKPHDCAGVSFIPLGEERLYAVVNRTSPLARRSELRMEELKDEPLISLNKYYQIYYRISECCQAHGFKPNFLVETGERGILLSMVKTNPCVFICTEHVTTEMEQGSCVRIPITDPDMVWEYGVVYKKQKKLDPSTNLFIQYLLEHAPHPAGK